VNKKEPKRILLARTDRLGDVVLSTAVVKFLREEYPSAYIAMLIRPYTAEVFKNDPNLDKVIVYDKHNEHKSFYGTVKFALSLRKMKFDTAIAFHPTNRVHLMFFVAGIPERIGYNRDLGWMLTRKMPYRKHEGKMHEADYNFELLKNSGFDVSRADRHPYIVTDDGDKNMVEKIMKECGIGEDFITIHAGASCPSKRWPAVRFAEVAATLARDFECGIVLIGGHGTENDNNTIMSLAGNRAVDLTDMLRVGELAELLKRSRLFISNDSGPVHIAVAVGTPVVCIFGRRDPGLSPLRWGPLGKSDIVLHKDVGCGVCLAHNCDKGFKCLEAVTVDEVVEAAKKILSIGH